MIECSFALKNASFKLILYRKDYELNYVKKRL